MVNLPLSEKGRNTISSKETNNPADLCSTLANLEEELARSKDIFIKDHKKKHPDDLRFPPCIKTLEIATFGCLSRLYGNLRPNVTSKDAIAKELNTVNHTYLHSWLQPISQIRLPKPPAPWIANVPPADEHH